MADGSKKKIVILKNGLQKGGEPEEQPPKFIRQPYPDVQHRPQLGELMSDMQNVHKSPKLDQFQSMTPMNRQSEINQRTQLVHQGNP